MIELDDKQVDQLLARFDKTPRKLQRKIIAALVCDLETAIDALRKIADKGGVQSRKCAKKALTTIGAKA